MSGAGTYRKSSDSNIILLIIIGLDSNEFSGIYCYSFDRPYGSQFALEDQYFDILCEDYVKLDRCYPIADG
jgi:hypothetical protein